MADLRQRAREAIRQEHLPKPENIIVNTKKTPVGDPSRFNTSGSGKYARVGALEQVYSKRTHEFKRYGNLYVNKYAHLWKRNLSEDEMAQVMSHEISHLKHHGHGKQQREYAKKIYRKYF